jgi:parallel beta-helix repeat protein
MNPRLKTGALTFPGIVAVLLMVGCTTTTSTSSGDGVIVLQQPTTFPIVINQPGSYRLGGNLVVPDANTTAIKVESRDVTIDLHGFAILGPTVCTGIPVSCTTTGTGSGIAATGNAGKRENIIVRNGTIRGMGSDGVSLSEQSAITDVRAISNGNNGIVGNQHSRIVGNMATANGNRGIITAERSIVTGNVANENGIGINSNSQTVVSGNTASFNKGDGIDCANDCTVTGNTVVGNGFGGSMPIGRGIVTNSGSTLIGNIVTSNIGIGLFMVTADGYVHNVLNGNNGGPPNPQAPRLWAAADGLHRHGPPSSDRPRSPSPHHRHAAIFPRRKLPVGC